MSDPTSKEKRTALRVGIFVTVLLAVLTFAVIMLGSKNGLFASKSSLFVYFGDIYGLVVGAPVRLAGLDVGRVSMIEFADDLRKREARVELSIQDRFLPRVRRDSHAFIDSKGLLGDKLVNISIGSVAEPPLKDGDTIAARKGLSIEQLAGKMEQAVTSITHVTDQAGVVLDGLTTPQVKADLQRIVHSTAALIEGVEKQDGVMHRLIYDPKYADEVAAILQETRKSVGSLRGAVEHVQAIASEVQHGQGTLHELVYGERGTQAMGDLRAASAELAALAQSIRTQPGLLHNLIYDEQSGDMMKQWNEFSERVNRLSRSVEQGRGTVGGLLVDPSVYEDMKTVLGNIERNVVFKALIRYTIKEDALQRPALMPQKSGGQTAASR